MNKATRLLLLLMLLVTALKSQSIQQLGYYNINGISALSAKTNYMLLGEGSLIDISNPYNPSLSGNISLSGFSTSVIIDSNHAYFGTGMNVRLIVADISNPAFPYQVSSKNFPQANGGIFGMALKDSVLYLAMGSNGVYSIDITNKSNPIVLDSIVIPNGQARDIITAGNYAYVAHNDGMKILDISNPSNLNIIAGIGSGYNAIDMGNNLVFLGKTSGGIDVFNTSNPAAPTPAFSIPNTGGAAWDLKYKDEHVYLATDNSGLFIYKISGNSALLKAHFANSGNGQSFAVAIQDSLILLSGLINGVAILQYDSLNAADIIENTDTKGLVLFPNPSSTLFKVTFDKTIPSGSIEVYSTIGKVVLREKIFHASQKEINIQSISNGIYFVRLFDGESYYCNKIIVQHK